MRRTLAAVMLGLLLLARTAAAQTTTSEPVPPSLPTPQGVAAGQASVQTSYLLALYMMALASAGAPPSPADINEATRQYLTNGAAATGVPSSGPAATYFRNGADVTGVPGTGPRAAYFTQGAEVLAYPSTASTAGSASPPIPVRDGAGPVAATPLVEDSGEPGDVAEAAAPSTPAEATPAPPPPPTVPGSSLEGPSLASGATLAALPSPPTCPACATATAMTRPTPREPPPEAVATPSCPPAPSSFGAIAAALGGAVLGGLAVVLWSRPRSRAKVHATAK
jgi:hypothetical protein